jgi:cell division inhibitor SepF
MESGIVRKAMVYLGVADENSTDLDVCDDPTEPVCVDGPPTAARPVTTPQPPPSRAPASPRPPNPCPAPRVHVVVPISFGDAQEIADRFREHQPVVVNLQSVDSELTRRLIDFCSGAAYALDGSMEKIAKQVLLLTPADVEVSADERRRWQARPVRRNEPARARA